MRTLITCLLIVGVLGGCSAPDRLVMANNFSFADFDSVVMAKPDANSTNASLYGLDVELANRLARYGLTTLGDKAYEALDPAAQKRVLFLRMNVKSAKEQIVISVSFDDAVSGRTVCSITASDDGDVLDVSDRRDVFTSLSDEVIETLARDKGREVTDD